MSIKAPVRVFYGSSYTDGYALVWNSSAATWTPQIQDAYRILNRKISATTPTDGYALVWNNSANEWQASTAASIRGSSVKVYDFTLGANVNCPLQTATNGTTSGSSKQISAPNANGLVTLTDAAATFNDSIIGKAVGITASATGGGLSQNLGYFIIKDRPSATTFRYYNGDAIADPSGITYTIVGVVPPGGAYGTFLPLTEHTITVSSVYDVVIVRALLYWAQNVLHTGDSAVQVDGKTVCFFSSVASAGAVAYSISYIISGLTAGTHVISTGSYSDYHYNTFYGGAMPIGNDTYCHFNGPTRSTVTVIPGISV